MALNNINFTDVSLRGATLSVVDLQRADMIGSDLHSTRLYDVDFSDAKLFVANFSSALGFNVCFDRASLNHSNFSDSHFGLGRVYNRVGHRLPGPGNQSCEFNDTSFWFSNLENADFSGCRMKNANFLDSNMTNVNLNQADMSHVLYQPTMPPSADQIHLAIGLDTLRYSDDGGPLSTLKHTLKTEGYGRESRQVNAALRRQRSNGLEYVLLDLTCEYGTNTYRPILILGGSLFLFMGFYFYFLLLPGPDGLYLVVERTTIPRRRRFLRRRLRLSLTKGATALEAPGRIASLEWRGWLAAFSFSLRSATMFGFRELNLARVVRLIPRRPFEMEARGWARTVSGLQAAVSLYLVALAVLSYVGAPFD